MKLTLQYLPYSSPQVFADLFHHVKPYDLRKPHIDAGTVILYGGGTDINPAIYGEEMGPFTSDPDYSRDTAEIGAFVSSNEKALGHIGICRGAQLLCALHGGKLLQHVNGHHRHHKIRTSEGLSLWSSSLHHQMMMPWEGKEPWEMLATASPAISTNPVLEGHDEPEVVFYPNTKSLCIQGHPEWHHSEKDPYLAYCRSLVQRRILAA